MGWWAELKASASVFDAGKLLLDTIASSWTPVKGVFTSAYHIAFLFDFLVFVTQINIQKLPDNPQNIKDVERGAAGAFDRLRKLYYGKPDELTREAQRAAFANDGMALKARNDLNLLVSAAGGNELNRAQINLLIENHPFWGSEEGRQVA